METVRYSLQAIIYKVVSQSHWGAGGLQIVWESDENCGLSLQKEGTNYISC